MKGPSKGGATAPAAKNNTMSNKYHTPADYGQFEHQAKQREEYEVYTKSNDEYDQYREPEE